MTENAEQRGNDMLRILTGEISDPNKSVHTHDELDSTAPREAPSAISIHPNGPPIQQPAPYRNEYFDTPLDNLRGRGRGRGRGRRSRWRGRGRHVQNFSPFYPLPNRPVPNNLQNFTAEKASMNSHISAPVAHSSPRQGDKKIR